MRRVVDFVNKCGRRALPLATCLSALILLSTAAVRIWFIHGYWHSFTDRFHVLLESADQSQIGRLVVCNSDLHLAVRYAEFTRESKTPPDGTSYRWRGFDCWHVNYNDGGRTYWFAAASFWYLLGVSSLLPAVWIALRLWRRRFRFSLRSLLSAMLAIALFFGLWSLTGCVGSKDVTDHMAKILSRGGKSLRIDHDPLRDDDEERFCHYVGNASSPFPLIVTADYGCMDYVYYSDGRVIYSEDGHVVGESGRACFLWLLGFKVELRQWSHVTGGFIGDG